MIEKRLRQFRQPHCGSIRIDETHVKIRGKSRYRYRAIDEHDNPGGFLADRKALPRCSQAEALRRVRLL